MGGGGNPGMGGEGMGGGGADEEERGKDATSILKQDHQRVRRLFDRFARAADSGQKLEIFRNVRNELQVHAQVEEEIFYPELEKQGEPELAEQMREAHHEHDEAKQLLARGESVAADAAQLEELVRSLREVVEHHVREEEGEIFPRAREVFSAGQLEEIGARLEARKKALVEQGMREMVEA